MALQRNPYFTCLDEEQIEQFVQQAQLKTFLKGEAVLLEGCRDGYDNNLVDPNGRESLSGPADVDDLLWETVDTDKKKTDPIISNISDSIVTTKNNQLKPPIPPTSGSKSYLYIIRKGNADVFYRTINPASLGPGTLFGEGGFLFERQHSASIVATSDPLECFVVDRDTFINKILTSSRNMRQFFLKYVKQKLPKKKK